MLTVILSAVTNCPAAVVNEGQLTVRVPAPGLPFARYTVPCTVVVVNACARAIWAGTPTRHTIATHSANRMAARPQLFSVSFIEVSSFFCRAVSE